MGTSENARITSLQLCVGHRQPMRQVSSAKVIAGLGIEGDAHARSEGVGTARQVLLMDSETLDDMGLSPSQIRENVTTTGLAPGSVAAGQRLALGDSVVLAELTGDCAPCGRMDEIRAGLTTPEGARAATLLSDRAARVVDAGPPEASSRGLLATVSASRAGHLQ